jgi:peptide/nickel transport system permease protein
MSAQETATSPKRTGMPAASALRRLLRRRRIVIPGVLLLLEIVACFGAPVLAPYQPEGADFTATLSGPSLHHLLGTDQLGRDVLSRLMYGGAVMFREMAIAVVVTLVIAVPLGLVAGLRRGRVDAALMRLADVVMSIPGIILLLIVLALFSQSMTAVMLAIGLLSAPAMMRVVRSASLSVGRETYVAAARVSGLSNWGIARRHILPRVSGLIVVNAALLAANSLLIAVGLNAIGLGVQPPAPTWGSMMADAAQVLSQSLWMAIPTGGIVALTAAALIILGDGVRDALAERWMGSVEENSPRRRRPKAVSSRLATSAALVTPEDSWLLGEQDPVVR